MASETIRDVVIRVSLKMAESAGALKTGVEQTKKIANESRAAAQAKKDELAILRDQAKIESVKEKRILDQLKHEKEILRIKKEAARIGAGGAGASTKASAPKQMQDPSIQIGGTALKIGKIFAAAMIIEQVPDALKSIATGDIWDKMATVGLGLVEGFEGVIESLSSFVSDMASIAGIKIPKIKGGLGASMRAGLEGMGIDAGATIEEAQRAKLATIVQKHATLEQQRLDIIKKLVPAENEQLKLAKEKLSTLQAELGMISSRDLEGIDAILGRKNKVGFGGLGKDELDRINAIPALRQALQGQAQAEALKGPNAALIAKIIAQTGLPGQVSGLQAAQDAKNREAIMKINALNIMPALNLNVDPTKTAEELTKKIQPLLDEAMQRAAQVLEDELKRIRRVAEGARTRAGAAGRVR